MLVEVQVTIEGSKEATWTVVSDIANAAQFISGINHIEIVNQPPSGLVGLRWREPRMLFGKPATAEKWITEAVVNDHFSTRAESDGFIFLSTIRLTESANRVVLTSVHDSQPQTLATKLMALPMRLFFTGVARKALLQDLVDIKAQVEKQRSLAA